MQRPGGKSGFSSEGPARRPVYCFITHNQKKKTGVCIQSRHALVNSFFFFFLLGGVAWI